MSSFYEEDLAYIHQVGFSDLARRAGEEVLARLREEGKGSGLVVDLGSGSGLWASQLISAGFDALGFDVSEPMLRLARQTAPEAQFHRASLYQAQIPPCRAVTAFGEALNYRVCDAPSEALLVRLFRRISVSLVQGGLFAFDVLVQSDGPPMEYRSWSAGPDWAVLVDVREEPLESVLYRSITLFRAAGSGYRRSQEHHVLGVLNSELLESLLLAAGFRFERREQYGDYKLGERRLAYFAHKVAI
ncbi:MAG: methyltransferase domain-containing protein [Acidobacteriota bacterium]